MVPLSFAGHEFKIVAPAALYWPAQKALIVADLHLEKASFYARQGQMLPPYDSHATLDELANLMIKTSADKVFCLGDNYHDDGGEARLEGKAATLLRKLTGDADWVWICGNHDQEVRGLWGGKVLTEWIGDGLALRHEACPDAKLPEISGHFHPKLRIPVRGRHVSRRCFVISKIHLIMPAYGTITGGMPANHPAIGQAVNGEAEAVIRVGSGAVRFPLAFEERPDGPEKQTELNLPAL